MSSSRTSDPLAMLAAAPRVALGHWPTPLEPCHRLRDEIGGPLIWLKRDDCSGLAFGGNKTRKLEFLLGAALAEGCTGVVTFGAVQSNHARQTAAACNRLGLACDLVLTRAVDRSDAHYTRSGNLLLDVVLGATVHVVADTDAAIARFAELVETAAADGRKLYSIRPGGSDPVGTLGYVAAVQELANQLLELDLDAEHVVVATSTAGTAAGLAVGAAITGATFVVDAMCVYHDEAATVAELSGLIEATVNSLSAPPVDRGAWRVHGHTLGEGYGVPSDAGLRAIELVARTEGVLFDPVYTGKALAGLFDLIRDGDPLGDNVVFVHTGGAPGLFAYAEDWPASRR